MDAHSECDHCSVANGCRASIAHAGPTNRHGIAHSNGYNGAASVTNVNRDVNRDSDTLGYLFAHAGGDGSAASNSDAYSTCYCDVDTITNSDCCANEYGRANTDADYCADGNIHPHTYGDHSAGGDSFANTHRDHRANRDPYANTDCGRRADRDINTYADRCGRY